MADELEAPACRRGNPVVDVEVMYDLHHKAAARELCMGCGAKNRIICATMALEEEAGEDEAHRFGIRATLTPNQRVSIERRGGLKGRDPALLVKGQDGNRRVPPIPDEGDQWSRNHTTLARKVMRYVVENVETGKELPTQAQLSTDLKCGLGPLRRVMDALVADGTLDYTGSPKQGRGRNGTTRFVRRGNPRAYSDWLPLHLR